MSVLGWFLVRQKFLHQRVDVLEATNPSTGRVPVVIVSVIDQFRQGQQETEMVVNFSGRAQFLQVAEDFDHFFDSGIDIGD
jgi:hypothetical protein